MQWNEFVDKLKEAKKLGVNNGLSVSCIANLIFAGAFDNMLEEPPKIGELHSKYTEMYTEARDALKSKAMLPKKNKNIPVGLADVKDDMQLGVWRFLVNPMSKFDFLPYCRENLRKRGYVELDRFKKELNYDKSFPLFHPGMEDEKTGILTAPPGYIVNRWDDIFDCKLHGGDTITDHFMQGRRLACMVGVITNTRKVPYGKDGKSRMVVDFYNGYEVISGLVIWPGRKSGTLPDFSRTMQKMSFGLLTMHPKMWGTRRTGTILNWNKFLDG